MGNTSSSMNYKVRKTELKYSKFKFKFIYSHLFNYSPTTIRKKRSKKRANYTLN